MNAGMFCNRQKKAQKLEEPTRMFKQNGVENVTKVGEDPVKWLEKEVNKIKAWFTTKSQKITLEDLCQRLEKAIVRFARLVGKMFIMGIILNIIASSFWPELPEKCPVIFGWFNGWVQLVEFLYETLLKGIYAFFTGEFAEFRQEVVQTGSELFNQFLSWLASL